MIHKSDQKQDWEMYCAQELNILKPILSSYGYALDPVQKHLQGERYLMHAITTTHGKKLILTGSYINGPRVVIKATRDTAGKMELIHEHICRNFLHTIDFAGDVFHTPEEISFLKTKGFVISIQRFIEQPNSFLDRPVTEQFSLALRAFKSQESAHATTFKHRRAIKNIYEIRSGKNYIQNFHLFIKNITNVLGETHEVISYLKRALATLRENEKNIEQYCDFLTHTDFVPHNIRVADNTIYLLDHSSLTFGNKYEGWARFINFMTLYNPPLAHALKKYVRDNRSSEEAISLRMMQIYRLGEIIWYYVRGTSLSSGNLKLLNTSRITFWNEVLSSVLDEKEVSAETIERYKQTRDSLRSEDEKKRQEGLH